MGAVFPGHAHVNNILALFLRSGQAKAEASASAANPCLYSGPGFVVFLPAARIQGISTDQPAVLDFLCRL
jgi:hypothetical protein